MKCLTKRILQSVIMGAVVPIGLLLLVLGANARSQQPETAPTGSNVTLPKSETIPQEEPLPLFMPVLHNGQVENWNLEEYLVGVLLSEMPASFEKEALKAQAVAARTYALKCHVLSDRHMGAVCTQSTCCQGYLSIDAYLKQGGDEDVVEEYRLVVAETAGEVLTYEGDLIVATYFSCSGGRTESALSVWGQDYPYLQSVESPGEENATYFADEKTFAPEQLAIALGNTMNEDPATWIGEAIYTEGGGIAQLVLGGVSYRGTTLRSLLGLRSTCFSVEYIDGMFRFSTSGYGHRVGMSQYGANAMALSGADYMAILQHYYPSTEIIHYLQIHP